MSNFKNIIRIEDLQKMHYYRAAHPDRPHRPGVEWLQCVIALFAKFRERLYALFSLENWSLVAWYAFYMALVSRRQSFLGDKKR